MNEMTGLAHFALSNTGATLASAGTAVDVTRNTFIYREAERADQVFYIEAGLVKIDGASPEGKFAVIALLGGGSFFGEACLAGHTIRKTNASAMLDSRLVSIRKSTMLRLLRTDPHISRYFTAPSRTPGSPLNTRSSRALSNSMQAPRGAKIFH